MLRRFRVHETDGDVVEGIEFSDDFILIRWPNPDGAVHAFVNREALESAEQFEGARFEWLDNAPAPESGDFPRLQSDLHAAIQAAIADHEGAPAYLMRFVVLAEIVDSEGERGLVQVAADGMMRWDTLGLLEHARSVEWAATNAEALES